MRHPTDFVVINLQSQRLAMMAHAKGLSHQTILDWLTFYGRVRLMAVDTAANRLIYEFFSPITSMCYEFEFNHHQFNIPKQLFT